MRVGVRRGRARERALAEVIAVGERFHDALAASRGRRLLDPRTDQWAIGDRVAWGELPAEDFAHVKHVPRLARRSAVERAEPTRARRPDGNVLFADGLPPAVIDFSPYWRPPAFASAVVVGDALLWEGADESLLAAVEHVDRFRSSSCAR